jgi:hypothetical protein
MHGFPKAPSILTCVDFIGSWDRVEILLRKRFQAGDKVIRPEMVTVYSHKENPAAVDRP